MSTSNPPIVLRVPDAPPSEGGYNPPPISWLLGTWHVTHSSLPMWKSKRNVRITYTALPPSSPSVPQDNTDRLDDLVEYQPLEGSKVSTVHGVDKAAAEGRDAWTWRGKGWLMVASSAWQVLGWGTDGEGNDWAVTYFAKTLFTPAGVDFYSRSGKGLSAITVQGIENALAKTESEEVSRLAKEVFAVKMDG
ncbi:hypothetical protein K461DRAFT_274805 [Myriangium duriaei CBS 260.36]|uniref:Uncharacterized protein n=1 Tax=Myriangium duriaei CBS 260.36 TaxID=1168546 RepID=A0A9P4J6T1_9PEZI|nr:hypothetical protein K461DRAFT_274805 [Myriangium duriaei CBS 260.36]